MRFFGAAQTRTFDCVELSDGPNGPERLTRAQFEALPIDRRVRAILGNRLRFFRGEAEVSVREALDER